MVISTGTLLRAAVVLLLIAAATGTAGVIESASGKSDSSVVSYEDPEGDQYGPGTYEYRAASDVYRAEYFDLRNFSIKIEGDSLKILLGFTRIDNPLKSPLGFSPQVAHVYIVGSCRSNRTDTLGLNVRLRAIDAWCACVVVAPNLGNYVSKLVLASGESLVLDRLYVVNNTIVVEVPARRVLEAVGGDVATWRYLVAVSAYDSASPDELIRIGVEKSDAPVVHTGANGESVRFLPRVLDILAKTAEDQHRMLSTFSPRHGDIATVGAYPYAENILLPAEPLIETLTVATTSIVTETYVRAYYLPGVTTTVTDYVQVPKYGLELYLLAATSVTLLAVLAFVLRKEKFIGE